MSDHSDQVLHEMLERSTERARRVLFFARMEVSEWGSAHVEPEHILLGIIREGQGAAYQLLFEKFRLDRRALTDEIGSRMDRQPKFAESIEIPFSAATQEVLVAAVEEADRLFARMIGTEHFVLGILRVPDSLPASILSQYGLNLAGVRERL